MAAHIQKLKYLLTYDICKKITESTLQQLGILKCLTSKNSGNINLKILFFWAMMPCHWISHF